MPLNTQAVESSAVVTVENLTVQRAGAVVLRDVSFAVETGDYVAIVGPNGSGKSTLLQTILGYVRPASGRIFFWGQPPNQFEDWSRIGYLPQVLPPTATGLPVTVREIVAMGLLPRIRRFRLTTREANERVRSTLALVEMERLADRRISSLSGGQRHRAFLARALVSDPDLLLLDEPTPSLDPSFRERFYNILHEIRGKKHTTILLVTHDWGAAGLDAQKLLYVDQQLIFFGTFKAFCESSQMTHYFGRSRQHQICHQHDYCDRTS